MTHDPDTFSRTARRIPALLTAALLAAPTLAQAQPTVAQCDWQASARNIPEPWEDNTRTFANGDVRVTLLDTVEPAAVPFYLMILSPPLNELGERQCRIVGDGNMGFYSIGFDGIDAGYDPSRGLTLTMPAATYTDGATRRDFTLQVTVNQSSGKITATEH